MICLSISLPFWQKGTHSASSSAQVTHRPSTDTGAQSSRKDALVTSDCSPRTSSTNGIPPKHPARGPFLRKYGLTLCYLKQSLTTRNTWTQPRPITADTDRPRASWVSGAPHLSSAFACISDQGSTQVGVFILFFQYGNRLKQRSFT